ncbi:extracellular calcium-sensing receptor-like [Lissotriton helveticus]
MENQVSYVAQHDVLSDKTQYPSFLRTVPPMHFQASALAKVVKHFGWAWIGILASDYDICYVGMKQMKEEVEGMGICVSFWEKIHDSYSKEKMRAVAQRIRSSSAKVIVCDCFELDLKSLLHELIDLNITDKIWIFSNAFILTPGYFPMTSLRILNGSLILVINSPEMPNLKKFIESLHPSRYPEDIFINFFWEEAFGCKWPSNATSIVPITRESPGEKQYCTGKEVLNDLESMFVFSDMSYTYQNYLAVYALAWALQDMMLCKPGKGPFLNGSCADVEDLKPWQMLYYVRNVRFTTSTGEEIFFDQNGDVPPAFEFLNLQISLNDTVQLVKVGMYDSSVPEGKQVRMKNGAMMWNTGKSQPPSFLSDSVDCWPCPEDQWPNERQTQCFATTLQFLSFEEPLGTALSFLTSLLFLITLFVLCAFRKYQDTPIVKANNRVLSYVLLVAIMLCFLSSFAFIGYPSMVTCMLRQNSFGISFAISISAVLGKTITVIIAFNARDPTSRSSRWIGARMPSGVVLLCSFAPVLICTVWLLLDPPFPVKIQIQDTTIIQCDEGSVLFFYLMLGYLGLLATVSFVVAFYARNLPQSFNEAKFLTFSMLVFLAVWISFIPAYLSTQGKYMVAVEIFAILSSAAGLLGCIFIPKCYIILWRADLNTKQYLMQKTSSSNNL